MVHTRQWRLASASRVGHYGAIQMLYYYYYIITTAYSSATSRSSIYQLLTGDCCRSLCPDTNWAITFIEHQPFIVTVIRKRCDVIQVTSALQ